MDSRELCSAAGDKASLAIAMAGLVLDLVFQGRVWEASRLASEAMALIESVGDPTLAVGLSFAPIYAKIEDAEWAEKTVLLPQHPPPTASPVAE